MNRFPKGQGNPWEGREVLEMLGMDFSNFDKKNGSKVATTSVK